MAKSQKFRYLPREREEFPGNGTVGFCNIVEFTLSQSLGVKYVIRFGRHW